MEVTRAEISFTDVGETVVIDCQSFNRGEVHMEQFESGNCQEEGSMDFSEDIQQMFTGKKFIEGKPDDDIALELEKELLGELEDFDSVKNMGTEEERNLLNGSEPHAATGNAPPEFDVSQFFNDSPQKTNGACFAPEEKNDDALEQEMKELFEGTKPTHQGGDELEKILMESGNSTLIGSNSCGPTVVSDHQPSGESQLPSQEPLIPDETAITTDVAEKILMESGGSTLIESSSCGPTVVSEHQPSGESQLPLQEPLIPGETAITTDVAEKILIESGDSKLSESYSCGLTVVPEHQTSGESELPSQEPLKPGETAITTEVAEKILIESGDSKLKESYSCGLTVVPEHKTSGESDLPSQEPLKPDETVKTTEVAENQAQSKENGDEEQFPADLDLENGAQVVKNSVNTVEFVENNISLEMVAQNPSVDSNGKLAEEPVSISPGSEGNEKTCDNSLEVANEPSTLLSEIGAVIVMNPISMDLDLKPETSQESEEFKSSSVTEKENEENKNMMDIEMNHLLKCDEVTEKVKKTDSKVINKSEFDKVLEAKFVEHTKRDDESSKLFEIVNCSSVKDTSIDEKTAEITENDCIGKAEKMEIDEEDDVSGMVAKMIELIMNDVAFKLNLDVPAEAKDKEIGFFAGKSYANETEEICDGIIEDVLNEIIPDSSDCDSDESRTIFSLDWEELGLEGRFISKVILEDLISGIVRESENFSDSDDDTRYMDFEPDYEEEIDVKPDILDPYFVPELLNNMITDIVRDNDKEVIVEEILFDIVEEIVEPAKIVNGLLDEILYRIAPHEIGQPFIMLQATSISPEVYERMKPLTPPPPEIRKSPRSLKRGRPKKDDTPRPPKEVKPRKKTALATPSGRATRSSGLHDLGFQIKEEPLDFPVEEIDIKPVVPTPEEIQSRSRRGRRALTPEPEPPKKKARAIKDAPAKPKVPARRAVPVTPPKVPKKAKKVEKPPKVVWKADVKSIKRKPEKNTSRKEVKKSKPPPREKTPPPPPKRRSVAPEPPKPSKIKKTSKADRSIRASSVSSASSSTSTRTRRSSPGASMDEISLNTRRITNATKVLHTAIMPVAARKSALGDEIAARLSASINKRQTRTYEDEPGPSNSKKKFDGFDVLGHKKSRPSIGISVRGCSVKLDRKPSIDLLLPSRRKDQSEFCVFCNPRRLFLSEKALVDHLKSEHAGTLGHETPRPPVTGDRCPGCDKKYHSGNRLIMHMKTCPAVMSMQPDSSRQGAKTSAPAKEIEANMDYCCETCHARYSTWSGLEAHKRSHWTQAEDPLTLEPESDSHYETQMSRRGQGLKMTIRRNPERFRCNTCSAPFDNSETLKIHQQIHKVKVKQERRSPSPELEILEEYIAPPVPTSQEEEEEPYYAAEEENEPTYDYAPQNHYEDVDEYVPHSKKAKVAPETSQNFYRPVDPYEEEEEDELGYEPPRKTTARKSTGGIAKQYAKPGPASAKINARPMEVIRLSNRPGPASSKISSQNGPVLTFGSRPGPASSKLGPASRPGPASSKLSPAVNRPGPASSKLSPAVNRPGPASSKLSPAVNRPGPASSKLSPAVNRPGPASSKLSPAVNRPGPASSKQSPAVNRPGPASSKLSPAVNRPGPASSKLSPAVNRPGPASSKLSPAVNRPFMPPTPTNRPGPASSKITPVFNRPGPASAKVSPANRPGPASSKFSAPTSMSTRSSPYDRPVGSKPGPLSAQPIRKSISATARKSTGGPVTTKRKHFAFHM